MKRCFDEYSLKSSVYNPTGQGCFERMDAYNSMSAHIRRVLLAKSKVDTENRMYIVGKEHRYKTVLKKSCTLSTDDFIMSNKLDIDKLSTCTRKSSKQKPLKSAVPSSETIRVKCKKTPITERNRVRSSVNKEKLFRDKDSTKRFGLEGSNNVQNDLELGSSLSSQRQEKDQDNSLYNSSKYNTCSPSSGTSCVTPNSSKLTSEDLDGRYTKFVYDITEEVLKHNLYTDEQLHTVFKRHLEKNQDTLDMQKMLYEVYQLKVSLNVMDDFDVNPDGLNMSGDSKNVAHMLKNMSDVKKSSCCQTNETNKPNKIDEANEPSETNQSNESNELCETNKPSETNELSEISEISEMSEQSKTIESSETNKTSADLTITEENI